MCVSVCVVRVCVCSGSTWSVQALETSHFKQRSCFPTCTMWSRVKIVIWPLFRKMPVNQKPLNRIEIFWYHFTRRKLLYLMVSVILVKFGPHGLSVFLGGATLYTVRSGDPHFHAVAQLLLSQPMNFSDPPSYMMCTRPSGSLEALKNIQSSCFFS